jgi:hypothetical protein
MSRSNTVDMTGQASEVQVTGEPRDTETVRRGSERDRWKSTHQGNSLAIYSTARPVLTGGLERRAGRDRVLFLPTQEWCAIFLRRHLVFSRVHRQRRSQEETTGAPAALRGWAPPCRASVRGLPHARDEHTRWPRNAVEGYTAPGRRLCRSTRHTFSRSSCVLRLGAQQ